MCLAVPAQIIELFENKMAMVNLGGIKREISVALLDKINVGDYVLVHVGFALTKLDEKEAVKTLQLFSEMLEQSA